FSLSSTHALSFPFGSMISLLYDLIDKGPASSCQPDKQLLRRFSRRLFSSEKLQKGGHIQNPSHDNGLFPFHGKAGAAYGNGPPARALSQISSGGRENRLPVLVFTEDFSDLRLFQSPIGDQAAKPSALPLLKEQKLSVLAFKLRQKHPQVM